MNDKLRIGLYGMNGHQIGGSIPADHPDARIAAVCFPGWEKADVQGKFPDAALYDTLDEMLAAGGVDMVSLCSPMRSAQSRKISGLGLPAPGGTSAGVTIRLNKCATSADFSVSQAPEGMLPVPMA